MDPFHPSGHTENFPAAPWQMLIESIPIDVISSLSVRDIRIPCIISFFKIFQPEFWSQVGEETITEAILTLDFMKSDAHRQLGISDTSTWTYFGTDMSLMFSIQLMTSVDFKGHYICEQTLGAAVLFLPVKGGFNIPRT